MTKQTFARLDKNIVAEILSADTALIDGVAVPGHILDDGTVLPLFAGMPGWVPCPSGVIEGWTTPDGGKTFAAPSAPILPAARRIATTYDLMSAFTDAQWAAYPSARPKDQRLFGARTTPWPEDNIKLGRIADALGTTPKAWFDAVFMGVKT